MSSADPSAPRPPQPTLQRDLLLRLTVPLLAIIAATGTLGVLTAQRLTERTFDHWLIDSARALSRQVRVVEGQVRVTLGGDAEAILVYDAVDRTYFEVRQGEHHVMGQTGLPRSGTEATQDGEVLLYSAAFNGQPVRVARVGVADSDPPVQVLVAETKLKRAEVRDDLMLQLLPLAALMLAAAVAIVLASRWTLQPLQLIASRWRAQSTASLQPIRLDDVPRELAPFAGALNEVLGRIHAMLERERRFAANAAHQIRTPLAGLQLGLERAAEAGDLASVRSVIAEMHDTTRRTSRLLQQLMALGRLDPEYAHDLERQRVDLRWLAEAVGEVYLDTAMARGVALELAEAAQPLPVAVQPDLVSEALGNLVDNALRYTPRGGTVQISFEDRPPTLVVDDSGPGIPADLRNAVTERFVRGPASAMAGDGSGLGLAIVREIAELHGAVLELDDSPLGGLTARLRFPSSAAPVASADGAAPTRSAGH
jgi:two-component system sensor histidine kinase TctE